MPENMQERVLPRYPAETGSADNSLMLEQLERIGNLLLIKGAEYAGDSDRLGNFRRISNELDVPMETVWLVYARKHFDSITQYVKDIQHGTSRARSEPMAGRVDDMIAYLLLFQLMLNERGQQ